MAESLFDSPKVKKYMPWAVGGVALFLVVYWWQSGKTATPAVSGYPGLDPATIAAGTAASSAAAAAQLAAQKEADAANVATATLAAQIEATKQSNEIAAMSAFGTSISGIIVAQDQIPVAAIGAASAGHQASLMAAAGVAASANNALPGILDASYAPLTQYGRAVANSGAVQAINSFASSINTPVQASASVANAAQQSATTRSIQQSQSNASTLGTIATIAAIAFL